MLVSLMHRRAGFDRRVGLTSAYRRFMAIARRPHRRLSPVEAPAGLETYEGLWVAVKGERVVAVAGSTRELVYALAKIGPSAEGATMQRVPKPENGILVGLG